MAEAKKNGWRDAARSVRRESKFSLNTVPDHFVVVKKWTVTAQEKMAQEREGFEVDQGGMPVQVKDGDLTRFHIIGLRYGVEDHNFFKEDGTKEDFTDAQFLKDLMEDFPEVEDEIFGYVTGYNRPLPEESGEK